jgi:nucleotidyltransferase AbiEii toxin of type IV toxin-antitoxin system
VESVARLSEQERRELFTEVASRRVTTPAVIEKDFWVTRTLSRLFQNDRLAKILMFKGGTSLSKVYGVIERFSEDIDLILDWQVLGGDDPLADRSQTKQQKLNESINEQAQNYIRSELFGLVRSALGDINPCVLDAEDAYVININYPAAFPDTYLRPEIRLEIGPLAAWFPHEQHEITSYAADIFPDLFTNLTSKVNVITAERTFWEKVTILHHEAHRPEGSTQPVRYSRHYYDLARLFHTQIKANALQDLDLLGNVVEFKQKFYPRGWARYDMARPGAMKLVPERHVLTSVGTDYRSMQNMIFGEIPPFENIMSDIEALEREINSL